MEPPQARGPGPHHPDEDIGLILERIGDAYASFDAEWRFTRLNDRAAALLGHAPAELLGRCIWEVCPRLQGSLFQSECLRAVAEDRALHFEGEGFGPGRWCEYHLHPSRAGLSVYCRDVTGARRAEAALRRERAFLRQVIDATPSMVFVKDRQGRFLLGNQALARCYGTSCEEVEGRSDADFNPHADELEHFRHDDREVIDHRQPLLIPEEKVSDAAGEVHWFSTVKVPLIEDDGGCDKVLGVATDITGRRQAEEALRDARVRLEAALSGAEMGTWTWALPEGTIVGDRGVATLCGLSEAEVAASMPETYARLIHPDDQPEFEAALARALVEPGPHQVECRVCRPDGSVRWLMARGRLVLDGQGRPESLNGVVQDVTERRLADEALREADRRKDEFLATLAHELRNPLAPIRNGLEILRLQAGDDPVVIQARQMMERQMIHLVRLVDDLMDVSRITRGKIELRPERVELAEVVGQAVETSRPLIAAAGHGLYVRLPQGSVFLRADPVRLTQLIANLLNNAAKYTPDGGSIWLEAEVLGEGAGAELELRVRDTGMGIPPDMLGSIFDMFTRLGHDHGAGGLGIGLTLARGLAEMHAGRLEARSPGPGKGSEFVLRLPLVEERRDETLGGRDQQAGPQAGGGRRVLVVDDNRDVASSTATFLEVLGHRVRVVHNGAQALAAVAEDRPEVILLDIGMPGMDGYEVARRLRADPAFAGTLIVAVTGWGQQEDLRRAEEAGFDLHLVKPVRPETLEHLLASQGVI
jgi:PAS domain S-box-containing protein